MSEEKEKEIELQVGDIVEADAHGIGMVIEENKELSVVTVKFYLPGSNKIEITKPYFADGRYSSADRFPTLKLIERPKKKKKVWVGLYKDNQHNEYAYLGYVYGRKDAAEKAGINDPDYVACVEIEVDDE